MLWACLLFPTLPLDVFARAQSPEQCAQPLVVVTAGHYPRVVAVNAPAFAAGIRGGHLISAALALAPELRMRERDNEAEMRALAQLATWALTFTPGASVASPDAVLAEIGGSLRLFSGLPQLVARLVEGAQALGYAPRLGLAPTPGAALLCARAGHAQPVFAAAHLAEAQLAKTHLAKFLAPVSLQLLDLPDTTRATLGSAGITTFGALAALPRGGLARRFGAELVQMLDRILGRSADPRAPFVPPPHFASRLDLPAPVHEVEALTFGVNRLVQELATWLTARGLGVVRLRLALAHERYVQ
ncbi:MAG: DNA polymerase Y family protein, partial [Betaproteobacteria bacterium]|nr:DNA polymerase Y family protein [Betaproteobacteria bacterium]